MPSAVLFLPCHIMELTNFVTRSDPYTGSGSTFRLAMYPFRGIKLLAPGFQLSALSRQLSAQVVRVNPYKLLSFRTASAVRNLLWSTTRGQRPTTALSLRPLGSVLRAALLAASNSHRIERAANHVIAHAGEILYAAAANQHDRVL